LKLLLETVTGRLIDVANPDPDSICIDDIAWGCSRIPRFCGQTITAVPYNVAQHSVFVAEEVEKMISGEDGDKIIHMHVDVVLAALLHDGAECYTGDLPSPVKHLPELHPIITRIEDGLMAAIYAQLGVPPPSQFERELIKRADKIAQKIEAHAFMQSRGRDWPSMPDVSLVRLQQFAAPMDSLSAYNLFMGKFNSLIEQRNKY
jgi:5'-deoxynucleotidase YfbR-like HD superfamily hydrolase